MVFLVLNYFLDNLTKHVMLVHLFNTFPRTNRRYFLSKNPIFPNLNFNCFDFRKFFRLPFLNCQWHKKLVVFFLANKKHAKIV